MWRMLLYKLLLYTLLSERLDMLTDAGRFLPTMMRPRASVVLQTALSPNVRLALYPAGQMPTSR